MPIARYKRSMYCDAIQLTSTDPSHVQEIITFVGLPISIDYTDQGVTLRVIRGALDVLIVYMNDYIVKQENGQLATIKQVDFETDYEIVGSG